MDFETIWTNIERYEGEAFHTITGKPFTYHMSGNSVVPDHTNQNIGRGDFVKAAEIKNLEGPGQIRDLVRGSAYVYAILKDQRIIGG